MEESTWECEDTMRATYPLLFRDEGTWFSRLIFKLRNYMHVLCFDCPEFRDEIPFKDGRM